MDRLPRLLAALAIALAGCSSKPKPIVYLDNGTAGEVTVTVEGLGERRVPAHNIMKIEVEPGLPTMTAAGAGIQSIKVKAELKSDRRYVFNVGGKNSYFIHTVYYTPQGEAAETATNLPPDRLGEGQELFAFPGWMRRDLNEKPPERIKVDREGEHDVKYAFHKPIHRERPCCSGIKHLHWPDEVEAAMERLENAVFSAQQEALQEQAQPETSENE